MLHKNDAKIGASCMTPPGAAEYLTNARVCHDDATASCRPRRMYIMVYKVEEKPREVQHYLQTFLCMKKPTEASQLSHFKETCVSNVWIFRNTLDFPIDIFMFLRILIRVHCKLGQL